MASMTILVDEARWPWRGRHWAHLISDESYDELHELARAIGKRRLGFQGDHYDVDAIDRARAIAAGATAIDSRQLVRRLVTSGLRRSDAKPRWERLAVSPRGADPDVAVAGLRATRSDGADRLAAALAHLAPTATAGETGAFGDDERLVVLIDLAVDHVDPDPGPWVELADEVIIGAPRADGERSIELFVQR